MKPKHYVDKYNLSISDKFNHNEFIQDFTTDFLSQLEIGKTKSGEYKLAGFENTVRAIRQKWDSVNNKTRGQLPDKLWGYFYAAVIMKMKKELFPEELEARKRKAEAYKKRREYEEKENDRMWDDFFRFSFISSLFSKMHRPTDAFETLGLAGDIESIDEGMVKKAYKEKSLIHHPDRGGKQEKFIEITEAKNKCLSFLESQK